MLEHGSPPAPTRPLALHRPGHAGDVQDVAIGSSILTMHGLQGGAGERLTVEGVDDKGLRGSFALSQSPLSPATQPPGMSGTRSRGSGGGGGGGGRTDSARNRSAVVGHGEPWRRLRPASPPLRGRRGRGRDSVPALSGQVWQQWVWWQTGLLILGGEIVLDGARNPAGESGSDGAVLALRAVTVLVIASSVGLGMPTALVPRSDHTSALVGWLRIGAGFALSVLFWAVGAVLVAFTVASARGVDTRLWITSGAVAADLRAVAAACASSAVAGLVGAGVGSAVLGWCRRRACRRSGHAR